MSPRRHLTPSLSRKRRIAEPTVELHPSQPKQRVQQTEIEELLPFDGSATGLTRLNSESSSSSSGSSSGGVSCPDFLLNQEFTSADFGFDDELEFLFNGLPPLPTPPPPPPPPPPPRQRPHSAEPPSPAILDCLVIEDSIVEPSSHQRQHQRQSLHQPERQRMISEYRQLPATELPSTEAAQAMLYNVNGLLASARRLNSETSLLRLQAAQLLDDVMASRRHRLAEEKPNSV